MFKSARSHSPGQIHHGGLHVDTFSTWRSFKHLTLDETQQKLTWLAAKQRNCSYSELKNHSLKIVHDTRRHPTFSHSSFPFLVMRRSMKFTVGNESVKCPMLLFRSLWEPGRPLPGISGLCKDAEQNSGSPSLDRVPPPHAPLHQCEYSQWGMDHCHWLRTHTWIFVM